MYKIQDDVLLHCEQCDPEQSQNHQLDWADFTQNCTVGNQAAGHTEVRIDQAEKCTVTILRVGQWRQDDTVRELQRCQRYSPAHLTPSLLSNGYSHVIRKKCYGLVSVDWLTSISVSLFSQQNHAGVYSYFHL